MLTMKTLAMGAALVLALGAGTAGAQQKLTGKAALNALIGNTIVPLSPEDDGPSVYLLPNGQAKSSYADGRPGSITGWKVIDDEFWFCFTITEPGSKPDEFATCSNMDVTGDTMTILGVNNYRAPMRIVRGNALK